MKNSGTLAESGMKKIFWLPKPVSDAWEKKNPKRLKKLRRLGAHREEVFAFTAFMKTQKRQIKHEVTKSQIF